MDVWVPARTMSSVRNLPKAIHGEVFARAGKAGADPGSFKDRMFMWSQASHKTAAGRILLVDAEGMVFFSWYLN